MFSWLKSFFFVEQNFTSAMGDLAGAGALVLATPGAQESITGAFGPWGMLLLPLLGYIGGTVSGRTTGKAKSK